jgi:hypothetical protein
MVSSIKERRCEIDLAGMCASVGIPFRQLEGNDVFAYIAAAKETRIAISENNAPACLEIKTALLNQHAGPTPGWPTDPLIINFFHDLIIGDAPRDPIAVLKAKLGDDAFFKVIAHLTAAIAA